MPSKTRFTFFSFALLLAIFALAFGMDRWMGLIRARISAGSTQPSAYLWNWSLLNLLLALCVLAFYTWVMPRLPRWALVLIICLGLLIDLIPLLYFSPVGALFVSPFLSDQGYLISAGAWAAVAGVFSLIRQRQNWPSRPQEPLA